MKHPITLQELESDYQDSKHGECGTENKLQYLGQYVFNFTTYDSEMDELFAKMMIETLTAIQNRTTFDYIKDETQYRNYLLMCNSPFLYDKLDWGGSIRGAWFDYEYPDFIKSIEVILEWVNS